MLIRDRVFLKCQLTHKMGNNCDKTFTPFPSKLNVVAVCVHLKHIHINSNYTISLLRKFKLNFACVADNLQCEAHSHQSPSKQRSILTLDTLAWRNFDPWFFTTVDVAHTGNPRVLP